MTGNGAPVGTPFKIGDREFLVPRLRVATFEAAIREIQAAEAVEAGTDSFGTARNEKLFAAAVMILRENYPDLDAAKLKEVAFMDEIAGLVSGLLKAGGKQPAGEAAAP